MAWAAAQPLLAALLLWLLAGTAHAQLSPESLIKAAVSPESLKAAVSPESLKAAVSPESLKCASKGCNLAETGIQPVCGQDGITYFSMCLAVCQGVAVASTGPCTPGADTAFIKIDPEEAGGGGGGTEGQAVVPAAAAVTLETLERFKAGGFKCVHARPSLPGQPLVCCILQPAFCICLGGREKA